MGMNAAVEVGKYNYPISIPVRHHISGPSDLEKYIAGWGFSTIFAGHDITILVRKLDLRSNSAPPTELLISL